MDEMAAADVVLVEDNPEDAELTLTTLREQRLTNCVMWLKDGVEALHYLRCEGAYDGRAPTPPRLVMLDLKLPKLDGIDVLRQMKQNERLRSVPVVMLTSSTEETDLARSYGLGVNSYVVKPIVFEQFCLEVGKLGFYWLLINRTPVGYS